MIYHLQTTQKYRRFNINILNTPPQKEKLLTLRKTYIFSNTIYSWFYPSLPSNFQYAACKPLVGEIELPFISCT